MRAVVLSAASVLLGLPYLAQGQTAGSVGIGTTSPNPKAALEITAPNNDQGLLIPRLDSVQRVQIQTPPDGLMVFQKNGRVGLWYAFGGQWLFIPDKARTADNLGNHTATQPLNLQGQALVGTGSDLGSAVGVGITGQGGLNIGQNTTGNNVFVGYQSGASNTTGVNNHFSGYQSGASNTNGNLNYFSGYQSGTNNTNGSFNHFNGYQSGASNTIGNNNHFDGYGSGVSNSMGSNNYFSGYQSGINSTIGNRNYFSGTNSGATNSSGDNNVFVGTSAGAGNTTGSNNTAVGFEAQPTISSLTNASAFGYRAKVSQSNALVLGGTGTDAVNVGIGTTAPTQRLEVVGQVKISGGNPGAGKVLTSDADGVGTWQSPAVAQVVLTGTTPSGPNGTSFINHLVDPTRLVGITAVVTSSAGTYIPPGLANQSGAYYTVYVVGQQIRIDTTTNSAAVQNQPIKVLLTYQP